MIGAISNFRFVMSLSKQNRKTKCNAMLCVTYRRFVNHDETFLCSETVPEMTACGGEVSSAESTR